ncbi:hypothetical protein ZIOFF_015850 [Zingiber officinale]|uniref:Uncharacterized protein n=1 Tax=Zingiber officinale TaxID=94328 RepID=A0A8J5HRT6_ZINOF|nr:hypothetical protein ZIOFF_015850 [Zingiber officinale]
MDGSRVGWLYQAVDHEMALRRQGEAVEKHEIHTHILLDMKLRKNIQNCFRSLKHMNDKEALSCTEDNEFDYQKVIESLKEARVLTLSLLQYVFNFLSMPRLKTKASRWFHISKALHKRIVTCESEHEDIEANDGSVWKTQYKLQTFQNSIEKFGEGLLTTFRPLTLISIQILENLLMFAPCSICV